jgi:hypothetical protein
MNYAIGDSGIHWSWLLHPFLSRWERYILSELLWKRDVPKPDLVKGSEHAVGWHRPFITLAGQAHDESETSPP